MTVNAAWQFVLSAAGRSFAALSGRGVRLLGASTVRTPAATACSICLTTPVVAACACTTVTACPEPTNEGRFDTTSAPAQITAPENAKPVANPCQVRFPL